MAVDTSDLAMHGTLAEIARTLDEIRQELRRGVEWGGTGDPERVYWDPAAPVGGAPISAEYQYDGSFAAIGIYNLSAGVIRVSFTPNGAVRDRTALLTLSARAFIVLPYRGTTVSVAGDVAGSALIVPFEQPQTAAAGLF
jgi:hypothetical protein